jgi:hypothetical protein
MAATICECGMAKSYHFHPSGDPLALRGGRCKGYRVKLPLRFTSALAEVSCTRADGEPFSFLVKRVNESVDDRHYYLQVSVMAPDTRDITGPKLEQRGRKFLLSEFMTVTEIVRTAWKAIEAFEVHELQERFRYRGKCIFNSHISVESLVMVGDDVDVRPEPA